MSNRTLTLGLVATVVLGAGALVACGDDTSAGGAGGSASTTGAGPTTSATKSASAGGQTTTASTTAVSGSSTVGDASATIATTATATTASASSSSTGAGVCMNVPVANTSNDTCDGPEPLLRRTENVACTPADFATWPAMVFSIDVGEQDCLFFNATNPNGTVDVADLFAAVIDPGGDNQYFDDDIDCAGDVDGLCPAGGLVMPSAGTAYVLVGAYESDGCAAGGTTDFRLAVSLNGVDLDISAAPVCVGDLNILIP